MRGKSEVEEAGGFEWIGASAIDEAGCLTLARSTNADQVAAAFGGMAQGARPLDFAEFCEEAFAHHEKYPVIGVRQMGNWTLTVEDNGSQGARPEVLRRVSHRTEVVSVLWTLQGLTRFSYAVGGEVWTSFEAALPELREGTRPDALERFRVGLPWGNTNPEHLVPVMMALLARITGETITSDWFHGEFATYPVAPWPDDLPATVDAVREPGDMKLPAGLRSQVAFADAESLRRGAISVAATALRTAGIDDHPLVQQVLQALARSARFDRVALDEASRSWTWLTRSEPVTDTVRAQVRALEVLRQATNPDAHVALLAAVSAASTVRGLDVAQLLDIAQRESKS